MADNVTWADFGGNGKEEPTIYYRKPNGWIVAGATQASAQMGMARKGFQPLPQYGMIKYSEDFWGPILRHPDGPAEFPVEQILTFRWYRQDRLPDLRPLVQEGRNLVRQGTAPKITFPQLKGVKIIEYPCPECTRDFHSPLHLGSHLRVMHGYDRSEILKYGDAMNIDFTKVPGGKQIVEYDGASAIEAAKEVVEEFESPSVVRVSRETPADEVTAAEVQEQLNCPDCGWVNEKNTAQGLDIHRKRWCKPQAVPA